MSRKTSLSGFHEWLPQERLVELHVLDTLAEVFELHGFSNIETRAVETLGTLLRKGEIDKEVYTVSRIHETEAPDPQDLARLALHFDLTVPFARYVTETAEYLTSSIRRYQIQNVWRGELAQEGRALEFPDADIVVVGEGNLDFRNDIEVALVMAEVVSNLPIGEFIIRI